MFTSALILIFVFLMSSYQKSNEWRTSEIVFGDKNQISISFFCSTDNLTISVKKTGLRRYPVHIKRFLFDTKVFFIGLPSMIAYHDNGWWWYILSSMYHKNNPGRGETAELFIGKFLFSYNIEPGEMTPMRRSMLSAILLWSVLIQVTDSFVFI